MKHKNKIIMVAVLTAIVITAFIQIKSKRKENNIMNEEKIIEDMLGVDPNYDF